MVGGDEFQIAILLDVPTDESQGKTECCGFTVYSVVAPIEIYP